MKKLTYFIIVITLFSSCYTTTIIPISKTLDTWIGATEQQVLLQLGPPTRVTTDGNSGKIYIYENRNYTTLTYPSTNISGNYPDPDFSTTTSYTNYLDFYFNADGKVYFYRTNYPGKEVRIHGGKVKAGDVLGWVFGITLFAALMYHYCFQIH